MYSAVGGVTQLEVNRHLELGRDFLAKGQLQDALLQYHAAVGKFFILKMLFFNRHVKLTLNFSFLEPIESLRVKFTPTNLYFKSILSRI